MNLASSSIWTGSFDLSAAADPLYIPPESPLAKNITAIARAVEIATGGNPLVSRSLVDLVRPFAQQFMGRTPAQILLAKILQDHGLDPDAEVDWLEKVHLRFEAVGFPRGWAQQTAIADIRRLFLEGSTGYRALQSPESMRGKSKRRHRRYWQTTPNKRPNDNLIAMHLTGEMPLSSFGLESTQVLTLDLDRHGDLQRVNFEETLKLAMAAFPEALPIRSSSSGGVHLLLFFDQPVSYQFLVSIARRRLEKFDLGVVHRGPCRFVRVEVPEQGVRLPLGQGSYLLTPGFNETSPVPEMLRALVQHAHEHDCPPTPPVDVARVVVPPVPMEPPASTAGVAHTHVPNVPADVHVWEPCRPVAHGHSTVMPVTHLGL
ncbi:MAG: hypothetical protein WBP56_07230 [Polyangia bacterium]